MDDKLVEELDRLEKENTIEAYNKMLELIDDALNDSVSKNEKEVLSKKRIIANIGILRFQVEAAAANFKKEKQLRGRLIKLLKKLETMEKDDNLKMKARYEALEELRKHKQSIKNYKANNKISIPEKVALSIQDISKSIEIFMEEKDVLTKLKNVFNETKSGTISSVVITAGICLAMYGLAGIPMTITAVTNVMPIIAYVGLASVIRNVSTKTPFEQYVYQQSPEYKEAVEKFFSDNKELIAELGRITKEKESSTNYENKIEMNEALVEKYDELSRMSDIAGVSESFQLQALGCLQESRDLCRELEDNYLNGINSDEEKYREVKKKLTKINIELFTRGNSIENAVKDSAKGVVKNTTIMMIAKWILSQISPEKFPLTKESMLITLAFAVINGVIEIPTYKNKLKYRETEYQGKIKEEDTNRMKKLFDNNELKPKLA